MRTLADVQSVCHELHFGAPPDAAGAVQDGDPYKDEMEQCVQMIMARLKERGVPNHHTLAYQSRVGPVRSPLTGFMQVGGVVAWVARR